MKFLVALNDHSTGRTRVTMIVESYNAVTAISEAKALLKLEGAYDAVASELWVDAPVGDRRISMHMLIAFEEGTYFQLKEGEVAKICSAKQFLADRKPYPTEAMEWPGIEPGQWVVTDADGIPEVLDDATMRRCFLNVPGVSTEITPSSRPKSASLEASNDQKKGV